MPRILVALGVSAANAAAYDDALEESVRQAASNRYVCAIGSCGIDAQADETQLHAFERQVALASELDLPLIVEAPGALGEALEVLAEIGIPERGTVLRAGAATESELAPWAQAGCYISFDSTDLDDPAAFCQRAGIVPVDRVLVESGAPQQHLSILEGTDPRCDQVVFVADLLQSANVPSFALAENWLRVFTGA